MMKVVSRCWMSILPLAVLAQLAPPARGQAAQPSLVSVRQTFQTKLTRQDHENIPVDPPLAGMFDVVKYHSPAGDLAAYLSPDPKDGKNHPAILWIFGGFDNSIGG